MVNTKKYQEIIEEIKPYDAHLVAVSKFKSVDDIRALYDLGQRDFGENYVQELVEKQAQLPQDIRWHFIGNLQRNKVKYIAPFIHLIHGMDSFNLLKEINKQAIKNERIISCLLQMHVAQEETKAGMDETEMMAFFEYCDAQKEELSNIKLQGVMGMASFTEDQNQVKSEFQKLKTIFEFIKNSYFIRQQDFNILSMGMSNDYQLALTEGATMLRVGSLLFGNREVK